MHFYVVCVHSRGHHPSRIQDLWIFSESIIGICRFQKVFQSWKTGFTQDNGGARSRIIKQAPEQSCNCTEKVAMDSRNPSTQLDSIHYFWPLICQSSKMCLEKKWYVCIICKGTYFEKCIWSYILVFCCWQGNLIRFAFF